MKNLKKFLKEKYDLSLNVINNAPVNVCTFEKYCEDNNITEPCVEDHIEFNNINWDVDLNRFYDVYKNHIYETLSRSYDYTKLMKNIAKYFHDDMIEIKIINSNSENKSFNIYYKNQFHNNDKFKSLLFLYNYHIANNESKSYYLISPNKPTERTDKIYDECDGVIYHITSKNNYEKIMKYGLKPKTSPTHDERVYVFAETNIKKLKFDILSMTHMLQKSAEINNKYNKDFSVILKIDLNKYKNKLTFYDDENVEVFSAYWTAEYIPPFCIEKININNIK